MPTPPLGDEAINAALSALETGGNVTEAARLLGMSRSAVENRLRHASLRGRSVGTPHYQSRVPPGFVLRGQSLLTDQDGNLRGRWDKTRQEGMDPADAVYLPDPKRITKLSTLTDAEGRVVQQWTSERPEDARREQAWLELAEELSQKVERVEPLPVPAESKDDLLAVYPVGDHHMGMLSWKPETGADYDLKIGARLLIGAMSHLTAASAGAASAVVAFMGDFLHYDSYDTVTPTNRNMLDSDSRFPKVARAAVMLVRVSVDLALRAHRHVTVYVVAGNHDPVSSVFLAMCLSIAYENETRVTVMTSPASYHYHRFGAVLLGFHHGHGAKMAALPLIMATDRPEDWGATTCRHWITGHIHTSKTQPATSSNDYSGCVVESVRILPPVDAWAHGRGYRPIRDMKLIMYHRRSGEFGRTCFNPDMLNEEPESQ